MAREIAYNAGACEPDFFSSYDRPVHSYPMPFGSLVTAASIAANASPLLRPGAGAPRNSNEHVPVQRSSFGEPMLQRAEENAENGVIRPAAFRTYHLSKSCGSMREAASPCTKTRLTRP